VLCPNGTVDTGSGDVNPTYPGGYRPGTSGGDMGLDMSTKWGTGWLPGQYKTLYNTYAAGVNQSWVPFSIDTTKKAVNEYNNMPSAGTGICPFCVGGLHLARYRAFSDLYVWDEIGQTTAGYSSCFYNTCDTSEAVNVCAPGSQVCTPKQVCTPNPSKCSGGSNSTCTVDADCGSYSGCKNNPSHPHCTSDVDCQGRGMCNSAQQEYCMVQSDCGGSYDCIHFPDETVHTDDTCYTTVFKCLPQPDTCTTAASCSPPSSSSCTCTTPTVCRDTTQHLCNDGYGTYSGSFNDPPCDPISQQICTKKHPGSGCAGNVSSSGKCIRFCEKLGESTECPGTVKNSIGNASVPAFCGGAVPGCGGSGGPAVRS
jgi:hypothetical protein